MPHISKKELVKKTLHTLDEQFAIILTETGSKSRMKIMREILTQTERMMLAKRIGIIFFLEKGFSVYKVSNLLKVSPSTVERFRLGLERGKYKEIKTWMYKHTSKGKLMSFIEKLIALGLTGRTRSFKRMVDEL